MTPGESKRSPPRLARPTSTVFLAFLLGLAAGLSALPAAGQLLHLREGDVVQTNRTIYLVPGTYVQERIQSQIEVREVEYDGSQWVRILRPDGEPVAIAGQLIDLQRSGLSLIDSPPPEPWSPSTRPYRLRNLVSGLYLRQENLGRNDGDRNVQVGRLIEGDESFLWFDEDSYSKVVSLKTGLRLTVDGPTDDNVSVWGPVPTARQTWMLYSNSEWSTPWQPVVNIVSRGAHAQMQDADDTHLLWKGLVHGSDGNAYVRSWGGRSTQGAPKEWAWVVESVEPTDFVRLTITRIKCIKPSTGQDDGTKFLFRAIETTLEGMAASATGGGSSALSVAAKMAASRARAAGVREGMKYAQRVITQKMIKDHFKEKIKKKANKKIYQEIKAQALAMANDQTDSSADSFLEMVFGKPLEGLPDDLELRVNHVSLWPNGGRDHREMWAGKEDRTRFSTVFRRDRGAAIQLVEYDSGSDDDSLGWLVLDTSEVVEQEVYEGAYILEGSEGSIYEIDFIVEPLTHGGWGLPEFPSRDAWQREQDRTRRWDPVDLQKWRDGYIQQHGVEALQVRDVQRQLTDLPLCNGRSASELNVSELIVGVWSLGRFDRIGNRLPSDGEPWVFWPDGTLSVGPVDSCLPRTSTGTWQADKQGLRCGVVVNRLLIDANGQPSPERKRLGLFKTETGDLGFYETGATDFFTGPGGQQNQRVKDLSPFQWGRRIGPAPDLATGQAFADQLAGSRWSSPNFLLPELTLGGDGRIQEWIPKTHWWLSGDRQVEIKYQLGFNDYATLWKLDFPGNDCFVATGDQRIEVGRQLGPAPPASRPVVVQTLAGSRWSVGPWTDGSLSENPKERTIFEFSTGTGMHLAGLNGLRVSEMHVAEENARSPMTWKVESGDTITLRDSRNYPIRFESSDTFHWFDPLSRRVRRGDRIPVQSAMEEIDYMTLMDSTWEIISSQQSTSQGTLVFGPLFEEVNGQLQRGDWVTINGSAVPYEWGFAQPNLMRLTPSSEAESGAESEPESGATIWLKFDSPNHFVGVETDGSSTSMWEGRRTGGVPFVETARNFLAGWPGNHWEYEYQGTVYPFFVDESGHLSFNSYADLGNCRRRNSDGYKDCGTTQTEWTKVAWRIVGPNQVRFFNLLETDPASEAPRSMDLVFDSPNSFRGIDWDGETVVSGWNNTVDGLSEFVSYVDALEGTRWMMAGVEFRTGFDRFESYGEVKETPAVELSDWRQIEPGASWVFTFGAKTLEQASGEWPYGVEWKVVGPNHVELYDPEENEFMTLLFDSSKTFHLVDSFGRPGKGFALTTGASAAGSPTSGMP